ncbi:MAG: TolC family outer membrane protein [Pseudomonadota bacterium]
MSTQAQAESLSDALVDAINSSPELAAGRSNVRVLSEQAVQARGAGRIQVSGLVNLSAQFRDLQRFDYPVTMQLDVVQPLFTGGQVENSTEAAETRITAEEARLIATEQGILLNTVTAFLDVRRDRTLVSLGKNNVRVINEQLRAARERFDVGEVTRTDVAQAESRLAAAQSLLAATTGTLRSSEEAYRRVVGRYPGELDPPPPLPDLPESVDAAIGIGMTNDPDVRAARLERRAAGSDVRTAIGALLPQVSLQAQVQRLDTLRNDNIGATSNGVVGLQVNLPFYSGGVNYSNVREAQAAVEGAAADINTALRDAAQQIGDAWADLEVARASITAGKLEVRAARIAFEGVQEEAKVGARTTLDVLDAEQELLDARGDLVTSQRDEYVAAYSLLFAVGKLTVKHLGLELSGVAPIEDYYAAVKDRNFGYDATDDTVWTLSYRP